MNNVRTKSTNRNSTKMVLASTFLKWSIFASIMVASVICAQIAEHRSADPEDDDEMRQLVSLATKRVARSIMNRSLSQARAFLPFSLINPLHMIAGLTLFGAFKLSLLLVSGFWVLTTMFPSVLSFLGISSPFLFRSLTDISELKSLNYEVVARSLQSLPDKSFELLKVEEGDCRSRAICEVGEFMASSFPTFCSYLGSLGDKFHNNDTYAVALMKGINQPADCTTAFSSCPVSPIKKLTNLSLLKLF